MTEQEILLSGGWRRSGKTWVQISILSIKLAFIAGDRKAYRCMHFHFPPARR